MKKAPVFLPENPAHSVFYGQRRTKKQISIIGSSGEIKAVDVYKPSMVGGGLRKTRLLLEEQQSFFLGQA
jgi:hypothetical protein